MKKIFWIFGIGLLILIIVVVISVGLYIGPIVKIGMQELGPRITQVSVKVDAVDVSLLTGSAKVKGLIVGNPIGYRMPQAISVGSVAVSMDPLSVFSNKVLVHSIKVESPEITFEGGPSRNNLSKILENVNAVAQNGGPAPSNNSTTTNNEASKKPAPKIEVDDFLITGAKVHVSLSGLVSKLITLQDIHLTDLGKDSNGLTATELTRVILNAIISDTLNAVTNSVTGMVQDVQNLGKSKTIGESVSKITNSLGVLFGK
jgi:hypothetical protein